MKVFMSSVDRFDIMKTVSVFLPLSALYNGYRAGKSPTPAYYFIQSGLRTKMNIWTGRFGGRTSLS